MIVSTIVHALGGIVLNVSILRKALLKCKKDNLSIVYYHIVSNQNHDYYFNSKAINVQNFRKQIKFLKAHFDIISLADAIRLAESKQSLSKKLVITFDDGFRENYSVIAPILLEEKIPATFYFITNCIDNNDLMWRNKLLLIEKYKTNENNKHIIDIANRFGLNAPKDNQNLLIWSNSEWSMEKKEELVNLLWSEIVPFSLNEYLCEKQPYCTSEEILEMSNSGFEIGSHSVSHPNFSKLSYSNFQYEINQSCKTISEIINAKVISFSYPFGTRARLEFEKKFMNSESEVSTLLGIKNIGNNRPENFRYWERDNLEFEKNEMMFRFLALPIFRKYLNF